MTSSVVDETAQATGEPVPVGTPNTHVLVPAEGLTFTIRVMPSATEIFDFVLDTSLGADVPVPMQVLEFVAAVIQRQVAIGQQLLAMQEYGKFVQAQLAAQQQDALEKLQAEERRQAVIDRLVVPGAPSLRSVR